MNNKFINAWNILYGIVLIAIFLAFAFPTTPMVTPDLPELVEIESTLVEIDFDITASNVYTTNFLRTQEIAYILGANVATDQCVDQQDRPGFIAADKEGELCYNWQGFDIPIPDYAYEDGDEIWEILVGLDGEGNVRYYLSHSFSDGYLDLPELATSLFSNYISEWDYEALMQMNNGKG